MEDDTLYYGVSYFEFIYNKYAHIWTQLREIIYGSTSFQPSLTVEIYKCENSNHNQIPPKIKQ